MQADPSGGTEDGKAEDQPIGNRWTDFAKGLPASELKPVSGSTTVNDGAGYSAEVVAYQTLDDVVSNIGVIAREHHARHVLVVEDRALLDSTWPLRSVRAKLDELDNRLTQVAALVSGAPEPDQPADEDGRRKIAPLAPLLGAALPFVGGVVEAAPKLVGAVADLAGLLRTNYAVSSRTMTTEGTPVVAAVAFALKQANIEVSVDGFEAISSTSPLVADLQALLQKRDRLVADTLGRRSAAAAARAQLDRIEKDRAATATQLIKNLAEGSASTALEERVAALDRHLEAGLAAAGELLAIVALVDQTVTAVTAWTDALVATSPGGRAPLLAALAREALELGEDGPTHVLFVSLDSAGADIATPASQIQSTKKLSYSGGVQVSFMLYNVETRKVVAADVRGRVHQATYDLKTGSLKIGAGFDLHGSRV